MQLNNPTHMTQLLDHLDNPIIALSADFAVLDFNAAAKRLFQWDFDPIEKRGLIDCLEVHQISPELIRALGSYPDQPLNDVSTEVYCENQTVIIV